MARILIVDDRPLNRNLLVTLLGYGGHDLVEAGDGAEALEAVQAHLPDLIITDILMPTMDGVTFVRHLHSDPRFKAIPVIFHTATYRLSEAKAMAQSCGVHWVLPKPCDPEEILATVNEALGLPKAPTPDLEGLDLRPMSLFGENLGPHLRNLHELNFRIATSMSRGADLAGQSGSIRKSTRVLSEPLSGAERVSLRLSALIEAGLDLATERDPAALLKQFCKAAQHILCARFAVLGIPHETGEGFSHQIIQGLAPGLMEPFQTQPGFLRQIMLDRKEQQLKGFYEDMTVLGLPPDHPPFHSLLAIPLASPRRVYGWFYLVDRLGAEAFSDEDEKIASTLGIQLAIAYENVLLLEDLQNQVRQRILAEEAGLRLAEVVEAHVTQLNNVFQNVDEMLWSFDPRKEMVLTISPACERIYGQPIATLLENTSLWMDAVHPDDRPAAIASYKQLLNGASIEREERILRPDGEARWVTVKARPTMDASGLVIRIDGSVSDISESRRFKERMALQERLAALGTLLGTVAHDLRNPLMNISAASELLELNTPPSDYLTRYLDQTRRASKRILGLLDELLDFATPKPLNLVPSTGLDMLQEAAEACERLAKHLGIEVELQQEWGTGTVVVDPLRMHHVLCNILENAIQHSPSRGTVRVLSRTAADTWICTVQDQGCGIAKEDIASIFDPLYSRRAGGTGLGLAIAHRIVQQHGGQLDAENCVAGGARFTIRIPQ
jgi:diguanylate cyclase